MKQSRVIQIVIIAANLVLAIVCLVAYGREDKVKPEFMFQTSDFIYYMESAGTDALLRDIMAYDDRDGDITERIVIEKVTESRGSSTVIVYYAVSDSAGNVAKISRAFPAVFDEEEHEAAAQAFAGAGTLNKSWKIRRPKTTVGKIPGKRRTGKTADRRRMTRIERVPVKRGSRIRNAGRITTGRRKGKSKTTGRRQPMRQKTAGMKRRMEGQTKSPKSRKRQL